MSDSGNKRIAKNTLFLYTKFIITTIISFVISRLVLKALGPSDYGLYNVVGGIVAMLNTLGTSMVATSYRYMAVEIGKGDKGDPNKVYNTVVIVHIAFALLLILLGETLGVFYINNYLNIAPSKIPDALFILHLSLLTTAFAVVSIPMNGLIIAREKFMFTSIVETFSAILKIALIFLMIYYDGNRLRFYAIILATIQFLTPLTFQIYCRIKEKEIVKWKVNKNAKDYKELFNFALWIFFGAMAVIGKVQGAAMIINLFFGTILNAAFGLATQINHAVSSFTATLRQAAVPQIMKSQGSGDENRSLTLVYSISKYSYLCMNIIAIPVLINIDYILGLWLDEVPEYTSIFVCFMLINGMVSNLGAGFDAVIQATGKIRKNQIGYSLINLSLLPIIYIMYRLGMPPYINVVCMVVLTVVVLVFQIYIMKELTSFNIKTYISKTIKPALFSTALAVMPLLIVNHFINYSSILNIIAIFVGVVWTVFSIYVCGITNEEKNLIISFIKRKLEKYKPHNNK